MSCQHETFSRHASKLDFTSAFCIKLIVSNMEYWEVNYEICLQVIEDDPRYWEVMSSALAVGWLDVVVSRGYSIADILLWHLLFACE